ncbi:MAG: hypothetical protein ACLRQY_10395 [[Clostridium] leptum]
MDQAELTESLLTEEKSTPALKSISVERRSLASSRRAVPERHVRLYQEGVYLDISRY